MVDVVGRIVEVRDARPGGAVGGVEGDGVAVILRQQAAVEFVQHLGGDGFAGLDPGVGAAFEIGENHLRVKGAHDAIDGVLEEQETFARFGGAGEQVFQEEAFVDGRGDLGDEDGVAARREGLGLVGEPRVHGVSHLVGEGEHGVAGVVVVQQHVGADAVDPGGVGAGAFALVFVDVEAAAGEEFAEFGLILGAEGRDGGEHEVAGRTEGPDGGVGQERELAVVEVVFGQPEEFLAEAQVTPERGGAGAHGVDQGGVDLDRDGVAVERAVQGGGVVAGAGEEPAAFEHAAVDGGVGVFRRGVGAEVGGEGAGAVGLHRIGGEQVLVDARREGNLAAVG